ncbi:MAG: hemolysin [Thermoleophilaceae bacterium]|nr:hemolysin [Thermoleophilaceae bacterium]
MTDPRKTRMAGISHVIALPISAVAGLLLTLEVQDSRWRLVIGAYTLALTAMFVTSVLYHPVKWTPAARARMRKIDRAAIFLLVGGTVLPLAVYSGQDQLVAPVLAATILGILFAIAFPGAPKVLSVVAFGAVGSVGAFAMPNVAATLGSGAVWLAVAACALYLAGAVVYAVERPNPLPGTFGYHDVFHLFVIAAAATSFLDVALFVLPVARTVT